MLTHCCEPRVPCGTCCIERVGSDLIKLTIQLYADSFLDRLHCVYLVLSWTVSNQCSLLLQFKAGMHQPGSQPCISRYIL